MPKALITLLNRPCSSCRCGGWRSKQHRIHPLRGGSCVQMTSTHNFFCCNSPRSITILLIISTICTHRVLPGTHFKCFLVQGEFVVLCEETLFHVDGGNQVYVLNMWDLQMCVYLCILLNACECAVFTGSSCYFTNLVCKGRTLSLHDKWFMSLGCVLAQQRRMFHMFPYYIHVVMNDINFIWC